MRHKFNYILKIAQGLIATRNKKGQKGRCLLRRYAVMAISLLTFLSPAFAATPAQREIAVPDQRINVQGGPGLVLSASADADQLMPAERAFINKYYDGTAIEDCRINFVKNSAEVKLADGTVINFDKNGKVKDIRNTHGSSLPEAVLEEVLNAKTIKHLQQTGALPFVYAVSNVDRRGTIVMLLNDTPPQMIFDVDGNFIVTAG